METISFCSRQKPFDGRKFLQHFKIDIRKRVESGICFLKDGNKDKD